MGTSRTVFKEHRDTGHGKHMFLTMVTCGMWAPVWAAMVFWNKFGPRKRTVARTRD